MAICGPNGSGKTTLLETALGLRGPPSAGRARCDTARVGYIAQNAGELASGRKPAGPDRDGAGGERLPKPSLGSDAHRFPLALAGRPLATLSPGERVRAALISEFRLRSTRSAKKNAPADAGSGRVRTPSGIGVVGWKVLRRLPAVQTRGGRQAA